MQRRPETLTRPGRFHFHHQARTRNKLVKSPLTTRHTCEIVRPMQTASIPTIDIRPDLFGNLAIEVTCEGHDHTPNGVLRWLSQHAQTNYHFQPSIRSVDLAQRFNISRRTLEAYRTRMKVPVTITWQIKALLDEIRSNASGLVPSSTPSETVSRDSANDTPMIHGLVEVTDDVAKAVIDNAKRKTRQSKGAAITKTTTSKKKSSPATSKTTPSKKTSNPSKKKSSRATSKTTPSKKPRNPSKK